jgi:4,4'-diaponeurosporenoate glycosyltransferase
VSARARPRPTRRPPARRLAGHGAALAAGAWLLWRVPEPGASTGPPGERRPGAGPPPGAGPAHGRRPSSVLPEGRPRLSVIIPARDEAASLPALLASLAEQTQAPDEIIVVDDHSTDATAALAGAAGAKVVPAAELPGGWLGKPWACHQGAAVAAGDVLVFLDADVSLAPEAIERLAADHAAHGGVLSVQPAHHPVAAYEQLSAVCNIVVMMGTGGFSGPPRGRLDMAFGPCFLVDRPDYERAGGHAHPAVRSQVAEDVALARQLAAGGAPVRALAGGSLVRFRMYPGGPRQLADGWSKMLAGGAGKAPRVPALLAGVWVSGAVLAARRGLGALRPGPRRERLVDASVYLAWAAEMRWLSNRVGRWHPATALAFPVPLAAFVGLCARSALLWASRRPARWRGRDVPAA